MAPKQKKQKTDDKTNHSHDLRSKDKKKNGQRLTAVSSGTKFEVKPRRRNYGAYDAFKQEKIPDKSLGADVDQRLRAIAVLWKGMTKTEKEPYVKKAQDMNRLRDLKKVA